MVLPAKGGAVNDNQKLNNVIADIEKRFGKWSVIRASEIVVKRCPVGIPAIDYALFGGMPLGRLLHIYGKQASGKSFLAYKFAASIQRLFPKQSVGWLDLELTFDATRAEAIGVDTNRLVLIQPSGAEEGFDAALALAGCVPLVVVDSLGAVSVKAENEGEMEDQQMAPAPKVINKFIRKWLSITARMKNRPTLWFNNQLRDKLVMYGAKEGPTGGRGLRFFVSIELDISRGDLVALKEKDDGGEGEINIGHDVKFRVVKNNTAPSDKRGKFLLATRPYSPGPYQINVHETDWPMDILHFAEYYGIITRSGAWFNYGDIRMGQGKPAAQGFIFNNSDIAAELQQKIMIKIREKHGVKDVETNEKVKKAGKPTGKKPAGKDSGWKRKPVA